MSDDTPVTVVPIYPPPDHHFIPVHIETRFRHGSQRQYATNNHGPVIVHAISLHDKRPASAVVEYDRYNGSESPLGLWTRILEVVPISELWDTATPSAPGPPRS